MINNRSVHIVGAGPSGLVAAINLARAGFEAIVHEQRGEVGMRFNGDFQGLENWSTEDDVSQFLNSLGIGINFLFKPYLGGDFYGPDLQRKTIKSPKPLFYLIERGGGPSSLDQGLKRQALEAGVKIHWNENRKTLPPGRVIVGTGPKAADAIAKGMVFETSHADLCVGFIDDRLAPKAYAYLLVCSGKATFATCLFEDFKKEPLYYQKALKTMRKVLDIDIIRPKEFGGFVNFFMRPSVRQNGRILYVGESAGFQDSLWGFGIKYAMLSGYLAAQSIIDGESYEQLCKYYILPSFKTSLANRWLYSHLGNRGYIWILNQLEKSQDTSALLHKHFQHTLLKKILFQIAKRWYRTRLIDKQCLHQDCNCVWCRHGKEESHHSSKDGCAPIELKD